MTTHKEQQTTPSSSPSQPGATTPLEQKVAKALARGRKRAKLSQGELAKQTDLSVSYVSMLERGQRVPTIATLETLAKALRVRPADMLR